VSDIGTWVQLIVVGSLVARDTGSAVQTGLVALATFMPQGFAAPFGGLLADRHDRRKVFALMLLLQALATGALAVTTYGLGLLLVGSVGDATDLRVSFVGGAAVSLALCVVLAARLPGWRRAIDGQRAADEPALATA